jgi:hypothetical protein
MAEDHVKYVPDKSAQTDVTSQGQK